MESTRLKIEPVTIKESLYQIAPFVGFALVDDALQIANSVFQELAISAENQPGSVVQESTRFSEGIKIQFPIYNDRIKKNMESLSEEFRENIPRYLTEVCFGDLYTRSGLDLKTREFLILCALCALGGTDAQIRSHGLGNLKVGNTFETILSALIQCLPWVGFPRVLNAINILKEVPY